MTISAVQLARALGQPEPTEQQQAVIEAPLSPALVVAGAGSGKTETMANRVLWLLANNRIDVAEVLGLTFTRKAAGELALRINRRIQQLREAGLLGAPSASGDAAARPTDVGSFEQPTVSTYNAFANGIFHDNALLVGREPESVLLNEASSWRLARRVVIEHGDHRLVPFQKTVDQVTDAVLALSRELSESDAGPDEIRDLANDFGYLADLPYTEGRAKATPYASVTEAVGHIQALPVLTELAMLYAEEKKRQGLVEYSDQVALALAVCRKVPTVVAGYRSRYKVVLLDEYQDTSVVQTRLLSTLFAGHGVMAVGDPHQSIYGWRGASEANLSRFPNDFSGSHATGRFALSVSWRNDRTVLDAANILVDPLRKAARTPVLPLAASPAAGEGAVTALIAETIQAEATGVAEWLADVLDIDRRTPGSINSGRSAAILFRARRHMELFARALAERGVPHHILGLGGLLSTPEVVDVVSTLRVLHDPYAGDALVRLLAGGRWRLGVHDLKALADLAGWLHSRDWRMAALSDEVKQRMRESVALSDGRSTIDALDFIASAPPTHSQMRGFSEQGLARLRDAGHLFASLRSRDLGLLDLVRLIEQELLLDIEVVANETQTVGHGNLHAFHDEISSFLAADDLGTIGSFLAWLKRAERQDSMAPRTEEPEAGTVQLLTIHGAKGLEWDAVAVPRMVVGEMPGSSREGAGWLRFGTLPFEFRGDGAELPQLGWRGLAAQSQFNDEQKRFKAELAERHQAEERRLAYVAVTRARSALLMSGSFWSGQSKPRPPSPFLAELVEAGVLPALPESSEHEDNPLADNGRVEPWPLDPLGERRAAVQAAAIAVAEAGRAESGRAESGHAESGRTAVNTAGSSRWERDIDLLLAERAARRRTAHQIELPTRIPASRFKDFVYTPNEVAASLRRPMPVRPYRQTRLGTLFHSWVEQRTIGAVRGTATGDLIDASEMELDDQWLDAGIDTEELARLQTVFEASEWGQRIPEYVEEEIHLPFGDRVVICKIDAVYVQPSGDDGLERYQVVDWKTGKAPKDEADLESRQLQLALYRLAFAHAHGVDPAQVDAVFYYVSVDTVVRPKRLYSESELRSLWSSVTGGSPA